LNKVYLWYFPFEEGLHMDTDKVTTNASFLASFATLVEVIRWRALYQPNRVAFTFFPGGKAAPVSLTYAQLDRQAQAIAAALLDKNAAGECALLLYQPGLEYIAAFLGCLYAGVIAVPAYPPSRNRPPVRLQAIAHDAHARLALSTTKLHSHLQYQFEAIPSLARLDWLFTDSLVAANEVANPSANSVKQPVIASPTSVAFLQYTSGSTAIPRGVIVSHANLMANLATLYQYLDLSEESRGVSWLPPYHDMGLIGNILLALYSGGELICMSPMSFLQQPRRWLEIISRTGATLSAGPNFAYELCVQKISPAQRIGLDLSHWRVAITGAEPVRPTTLAEFSAAFAECGFRQEAFYPCYGLAEATLIVSGKRPATQPIVQYFAATELSMHRVKPLIEAGQQAEHGRALVSCGQALSGQCIEIVEPGTGKRCLPAAIGEVWVKGPCVAQGYWNQPLQSGEIFHTYLTDSGEGPFLRTGDLGFLYQGELYITGRLKELIIIRGRNYYPQDLELTAQRSHSLLRQGGGAAFSIEQANEEQLAIACELEHQSQYREEDLNDIVHAVRRAVWEQHELEVPTIVLLESGAVPRTSSGKIQRLACRDAFLSGELATIKVSSLEDRRAELARSYVAPRTADEELLIHIWSEVLGIEHIGVLDNFFDLGGNSILAGQIIARIQDACQLELSLHHFLEAPTIAELSHLLEPARLSTANLQLPPIQPVARTMTDTMATFPLSYAQEYMWSFEQALISGSAAQVNNIPLAAHLKGPLDLSVLTRCFEGIVRRHDILRTTFVTLDDCPFQVVHPYLGPESAQRAYHPVLSLIDLTKWSDKERDVEVLRLLKEEQSYVFDLSVGPLLHIKLIRLAIEEWVLLLNIHHIISDGWSLGVLAQELSLLYNAFSHGQSSPLPALPIQYADYALWERQQQYDNMQHYQLAYWQKQLVALPPLLELPTDHPRPAVRRYRETRYFFALPQNLCLNLMALSKREGVTLFITLLAAFKVLLYLHCRQTDIIVGSIIANRVRAETEGIIGPFINPVALRTNLEHGNLSFQRLLHRVQATVAGAYAHQQVPFQHVMENLHRQEGLDATPLFLAMLVMRNTPQNVGLQQLGALEVQPLRSDWVEWEGELETTELELHMAEGKDERLYGEVCYASDLFSLATIKKLMVQFQTILEEAVLDPEQLVKKALNAFLCE
jgi:acyl-CoA synthetase (AMP-forming)/AMP-acid ligase II